ncbi:hypothetical protein [Streptomyces echinatus]|jgi:hypothetical protein|uniref:hypothetical protein n=1 Tax=Streptomyces echinatus TaxID=67293 RepID=UPI00378C8382
MTRAAVLIGVHKAGDLPELEAVGQGIDHMHDWVKKQGIPDRLIRIISDTTGNAVRCSAITAAVTSFVNRRSLEQIIIYFCGHGIYRSQSEYWLLSEAPDNPNEAVNVAASIALAEQCRVPHVVLISDACRTAPASIQYDRVHGGLIFPNRPPSGTPASADVFYSSGLGDSSFEIRDPKVASRAYHAVYTEVMAKALKGGYPELLEAARDGSAEYVRPYPLKDALPELLSKHIRALGATLTDQTPDSTVTSNQLIAWLSRFPKSPASSSLGLAAESDDRGADGESGDSGSTAANGGSGESDEIPLPVDRVAAAAAAAAARLERSRNPGAIDAPAAVHVQGAVVKAVYSGRAQAGRLTDHLVQVWLTDSTPDSSVLLHLDSGHCAVVPALLGRLATVTIEDNQLVDVSYAPLAPGNSSRKQLDPIYVKVRARIAAASRYGISWWNGAAPENLVDIFYKCGESDPSLAVYFSHALASLGRRDLVRKLQPRNGRMLYDVMLVGNFNERKVVPFLPLLSRGWALLGLSEPDIRLSTPIPRNSHWTLFADADLLRLRELLDEMEGM